MEGDNNILRFDASGRALDKDGNPETPPIDFDNFLLAESSESMEARMLADVFVLGMMAIMGQFTVFYGGPNAGKTLIGLKLLIEAIQAGKIDPKNVYYINKRIKGAHACSFASGGEAEDSMDKDHFYYQEQRWKLDSDLKRHEFRTKAHSKWKAYYAEYRKANRDDCPTKRVSIPRNRGEIEIIDIHTE